jgi:mRNA interferase RelE/StbE
LRVLFRESFLKDIEALKDSAMKKRVRKAIVQVEQAATLKDIGTLKKLKGGGSYYRIRIGDYRLGLTLEESIVVFIRCLHRKDIYRYFP